MKKSLRRRFAEAKKEGLDMSYVVADVTKASDVKNYVDKTISEYKKIDLFFNNAGTCSPMIHRTLPEVDLSPMVVCQVNDRG